MELQSTSLQTARRKPYLALLLSLITPGLGQIYNGQLKKGLLIYSFLTFGFLILFRLVGVYHYFSSMVIAVSVVLLIQVYAIFNAFSYAGKQQQYVLKSFNNWYVYAGMIILLYVVFSFMPLIHTNVNFGTHTFTITSPSMEPTLQAGDHIVSNLSINVDDIVLGDIVMFKPDQKQLYVSRVVALPGDLFELKNDFLIINGKASRIHELSAKYIDYEPHLTFEETLPNGRIIQIHKIESRQGRVTDVPSMMVPRDSVVMISDNRDDALDSRYLGLVPRKAISGKVLYTFWGNKPGRIGIDLTQK